MQEKHPHVYSEIMDMLMPYIDEEVSRYYRDKEEYEYYDDKDSSERKKLIGQHVERLE